jgi:hypothetical protein
MHLVKVFVCACMHREQIQSGHSGMLQIDVIEATKGQIFSGKRKS